MARDLELGLARTRIPLYHAPTPRRGAGVVERGGLENRCARKRTQGSNPCLSAILLLLSQFTPNALNEKDNSGTRNP